MANRTGGGLIRFSVALDEEMMATLDRLAEERGPDTTRSDVVREALRLGAPEFERQTMTLKQLHPQRESVAV